MVKGRLRFLATMRKSLANIRFVNVTGAYTFRLCKAPTYPLSANTRRAFLIKARKTWLVTLGLQH